MASTARSDSMACITKLDSRTNSATHSVQPLAQIGMIAGLPYTALRDAVLIHPTLIEGLLLLFSSVASEHNVAEPTLTRASA
jgi:hypothetical protein